MIRMMGLYEQMNDVMEPSLDELEVQIIVEDELVKDVDDQAYLHEVRREFQVSLQERDDPCNFEFVYGLVLLQ